MYIIEFFSNVLIIDIVLIEVVGRSSIDIIGTRYGLDDPRRFSTPEQTGTVVHPASYTLGTGSFPGVRCGRGVALTTHPHLQPRLKKE
jgi:hypothetical protein